MAGEMFKMMAGVDMTIVPYRGTAPMLTDLLGGQLQVTIAMLLLGRSMSPSAVIADTVKTLRRSIVVLPLPGHALQDHGVQRRACAREPD